MYAVKHTPFLIAKCQPGRNSFLMLHHRVDIPVQSSVQNIGERPLTYLIIHVRNTTRPVVYIPIYLRMCGSILAGRSFQQCHRISSRFAHRNQSTTATISLRYWPTSNWQMNAKVAIDTYIRLIVVRLPISWPPCKSLAVNDFDKNMIKRYFCNLE